MDYEEFRWALGDQTTVPLLQQAFIAGQAAEMLESLVCGLTTAFGGLNAAYAEQEVQLGLGASAAD